MNMKSSIREQLLIAFPVNQADVLAEVVVEAHDALATKSDIHDIREVIKELVEAQRDTDRSIGTLTEKLETVSDLTDRRFAEMAESRRETDRLISEHSERTAKLSETTDRRFVEMAESRRETDRLISEHSERIAKLSETTDQRFVELADAVRESFHRHDRADGWTYELVLAKRLPSYFGRHFKRCRVVEIQDVIESLEPLVASGVLTDTDLDDLRLADIIATARIDGEPGYLVGEVSCTGDTNDISRATRRAAVVTKAGQRAVPFVACYDISSDATEAAARAGVLVLRRGRLLSAAG